MQQKDYMRVVKHALTEGAEQTTLTDLKSRGMDSVKVIRAAKILELIEKAVDRALQEIGQDQALSDRQRLINESEKAFRELLQDRTRALEQGRDELINEYKQRIVELEARVKDLDGRLKQAIEAESARREDLKAAFADIEKLKRRRLELEEERDQLRKQLEGEGGPMRDLEEKLVQIQSLTQSLAQRDAELQDKTARLVTLEPLREQYDQLRTQYEETRQNARDLEVELRTLKEVSVPATAVNDLLGEFRQMKQQMQESVAETVASAQKPSTDGAVSVNLTEQLEKITKGLSDRIERIGRSVGAKMVDEPAVSIADIFKHGNNEILESNIHNLEVQERKAGSVSDSLARLKKMKKGRGTGEGRRRSEQRRAIEFGHQS
ncbi:MAG: hypothetical protein U1E76_19560 [Planctomycetota bacterium]